MTFESNSDRTLDLVESNPIVRNQVRLLERHLFIMLWLKAVLLNLSF